MGCIVADMAATNMRASCLYVTAHDQNSFDKDRHMNEEPGQTTTLNPQDLHRSVGTLRPCRDMTEYVREYAREKPAVVALWCLGIGFVLGWKLKPW